MDAAVKHSSLNPFASCFIPTSFRIGNVYTQVKNEVKKEDEVATISSTLEDLVCQNKDSNTVLRSSENKGLAVVPEVVNVSERIDHEDVAIDLRKDSDVWSTSSVLAFLELLVLILYGFYLRKDTRNTDKSHKKPDSLKELKCSCPPMFGYVIPPNFFGNPFNFSYSCKKNCIHTSHFNLNSVQEEVPCIKYSDLDETFDFEAKTTLEQCSYELKRIVKDVCETISESTDDSMDQQIDSGENENPNERRHAVSTFSFEDVDNEAMEYTFSPIGTKFSSKKSSCSTNDLMEIPKDLQIDDEDHPLLNEANVSTDNDEVFVGVPDTVKKMIEAALSSKPDLLLDLGESETCNTPCSFWCDTIPQTARDSHRKFLKWFSEQDDYPNLLTKANLLTQKSTYRRPLYNRSFSENDSIKKNRENVAHIQTSCIKTEARERLALLRRDPLTYLQPDSGYALRNRSNSLPSALKSNDLHHSVNKSIDLCKNNKCSIWGPFDGEDSLWQPLPDCVPTKDNSFKQNNRKARGVKRQESVN